MKYIILSDGTPNEFEIPRQLSVINGEAIISRTIRLLKENGVKDIVITSHDKRFDNLEAERYEPKFNDWDYNKKTGYWLSAFPIELLNDPVCFLFGDVYYSENAIKTIVETEVKDNLFFCTYNNQNKKYIKCHDEPLAYKVIKPDVFKAHIEQVKRLKDEGLCCREPIVWELYRSLNGQDINKHIMTNNYIAINDESCDIDSINDIIKLKYKLGGIDMIKVKAIKDFTLEAFDKIQNIVRANTASNQRGHLYKNDEFECDQNMCDYLMGKNRLATTVIEVLEIIPEEKEEAKIEVKNEFYVDGKKIAEKIIKPKTTKKKKTSKK